jgi:energy-coupling factor transporter ATP-binding protein EcfA2
VSAGGGRASHAIELDGVSFVYPDGTRALRDVSLAVPEGGRVAIVGQNGSGKSTLLRHLNGLLRPSTGRVLVRGRETAGVPVERIARQVGLLFQNPDLQIFEEQVADEVAFGPRNLGLTGADLAIAVTEALEAVGLRGLEHANPFNLGFSRRKLVALAAILAMRTPIVALDEPTTGQDGRGLSLVEGIVRRLADEGRTVLATSHDMRFVAETFERVVVMREGAIVADGTPDEVFAPAAWGILRSTHLDPPPAALVGAALGLGSTPTEAQLVAALRERAARYG